MSALLEVRDLALVLAREDGEVPVVDGVDLVLDAGETLGLVGESGCGKTLTALALLGLLPPNARVTRGSVRFRGRELLGLSARERRALLGRELAMSFQEPASALNPVLSIGAQVAESVRRHLGLGRRAAWSRAVELLAEAGLDSAAERARRIPSELSGGQRQRAMLALALAAGPAVLVADEPTSALDTTVQAEILARLAELRARRGMALLLVTHDLAVVAELAGRVAVMYAGRIVEEAEVLALFERPSHPYTLALLRSRLDARAERGRLPVVPGQVPAPGAWPAGCRFHPRCPPADERCTREVPRLLRRASGSAEPAARAPAAGVELRPPDPELGVASGRVACHHPGEGGAP
jgi:oligopeptide/dipeptide ABC transporter ATP-binding protein